MTFPTFNDISQVVYNGLVRLEVTGGVTTWEAMPGALHNGVVDDIRQEITRLNLGNAACGCYHIADTYIQLAPTLLRRPDIAIFCERPPRPDGAITGLIPGAVIEILSLGYEQKDRDAVALYLAAGVQDVVLVNPRGNLVEIYRTAVAMQRLPLPATETLLMGCHITFPAVAP